jgi:pyruvate,water dikinase
MTMTEQQSAPAGGPAFPVTWDDPADAQLYWTHNSLFYPDPVTPMTWSVLAATLPGWNRAVAGYGLPARLHMRRINTYLYGLSGSSAPLAEAAEEDGHGEERLQAAITRLGELWDDDLLPEIRGHLTYWEIFDLPGAPLPALLAHLDETVARRERLVEIEMLANPPGRSAISLFDDLYADLFGDAAPGEAMRLVQGLGNKTLETDLALWQLSRRALAVPLVREIIATSADETVTPALAAAAEGRAFLAELQGYLAEYGQRSSLYMELAAPFWVEDPTPVMAFLREHVAHPERDLAAGLQARAAEREHLVGEARARLRGYPAPVRAEFERLLRAAQYGTIHSEDHNYWLDCRATYQVRRVLREWGRRLAEAGAVEEREDVFYLTLDEVRRSAGEMMGARRPGDLRALVAARQAEMAYYRTIAPPPALGTAPSLPQGPLPRLVAGIVGAPPPEASAPDIVPGSAGSPGVARGRARVILSLAEAGRLQAGEVLVARTTLPQWTPLFARAAAIVTDAGGVLSHCAIVAREYGLPAVVGTRTATQRLRDGQLLEVDGTAGVVRLLAIDG